MTTNYTENSGIRGYIGSSEGRYLKSAEEWNCL